MFYHLLLQDSILDPLLSIVYINGIESTLQHSSMTVFADDMAFYCPEHSAIGLKNGSWLREHKLTLNIDKSKFMILGGIRKLKNLRDGQLVIGDDQFERVSSFKYLNAWA